MHKEKTTKRPKRTGTDLQQQTCLFTNVHVFPNTFLKISSPTLPITTSRKNHETNTKRTFYKIPCFETLPSFGHTNINCFTSHFQYLIFRWKYSPTTCFYVQKWQLWITKRTDYRPLLLGKIFNLTFIIAILSTLPDTSRPLRTLQSPDLQWYLPVSTLETEISRIIPQVCHFLSLFSNSSTMLGCMDNPQWQLQQ